jgi:hypothetical protein
VYPSASDNIALDSTYAIDLSCCAAYFPLYTSFCLTLRPYLDLEQYFLGLNISTYDTTHFKMAIRSVLRSAFDSVGQVVSLTFAPNIYFVNILSSSSSSYASSMSYSVTVMTSDAVALTKTLIAFCNQTVSVPFDRDLAYRGYSTVTFYRSPRAPTLIITPVTSQPTLSPFIFIGAVNPPKAPTASIPTALYFANISVAQVRFDCSTCYGRGAPRFVGVHVE